MTPKEVYQEALKRGLCSSPTDFWKGQKTSGLSPEDYLTKLRLIDSESENQSAHLQISTGQIGKYQRKEDEFLLDVTVKSGEKIFAPTWAIVSGYKDGTLSAEEYTKIYVDKMNDSRYKNHEQWSYWTQKYPHIVLLCYCPANQFCHRHILKNILKDYAVSCGMSASVSLGRS